METRDGSFGFDLTAQYTEVIPMKRIVYTLGEMKEYFLDAGRIVETNFEETPDGVKITQTFDGEDTHSNEQQIEGWTAILENLKTYVESL